MTDLRRALFGYSSSSVGAALAEREQMFERATRQGRSADERAARLATELQDTHQRLRETAEQLRSAQDLAGRLAADLERSLRERESIEADMTALHADLTAAKASVAGTQATTTARDRELRAANERAATLEAELAERTRERDGFEQLLASERAHSARYKDSLDAQRARVDELEELLGTYRAELQERATPTPPRPEAPPGENEGPSTWRELAAVLQVTEETVIRIMESTKARADEQLRRVDEDRERINREVESMKAWRDRAAPMITSMQSAVDDVLRQADQLGTQVTDALRPVTSAVTRLSSQLSSLDALSARTLPPNERVDDPRASARVIELPDNQTAGREGWRER